MSASKAAAPASTTHSTLLSLSLSLLSCSLSLSGAALLADDLLPLTADRYPFSSPQSPCPSPPFAPRSAAADRYPLAVPATITIRRPGVPRTRDGAGHPARHRRAFPKKLVFFLISLATTCRSLVDIAQPIKQTGVFHAETNLHQPPPTACAALVEPGTASAFSSCVEAIMASITQTLLSRQQVAESPGRQPGDRCTPADQRCAGAYRVGRQWCIAHVAGRLSPATGKESNHSKGQANK